MFDTNILNRQTQPNVLASYLGGMEAGQQVNDQRQRNALAQYASQNGAAIMRGDQSALEGLSGFGLQGLELAQNQQGIQFDREATRLDMAATRQNMAVQRQTQARLDRQEARQIREALQQADAAAIAEERNVLEGKLSMLARLHAQGDREGFAGLVTQWGMDRDPNDNITYDNFMSKAGEFTEVLEIYSEVAAEKGAEEPASIQALRIRAAEAGLQPGSPEYQSFMATGGKEDGMAFSMAPDGTVRFGTGSAAEGAANAKSLTVDEGKNTGFLIRAEDSQDVLNRLDGQGTDFGARLLGNAPMGVGNFFQSPEYQQYDQARRDFVNAILRRESGAVISVEEFANAERQYFPQPGDGPEVIEQKRRNRANAIEGLRVGAGDGVNRIESAPQMPPAPAGIDPNEWESLYQNMSPEDQALFQ